MPTSETDLRIKHMKSLEFALYDNAYQVHYSKRDESFSHEFGTERNYSWVILFVQIWCPISDEWLEINPTKIKGPIFDKILQKIELAQS